MHPHIPHPPTHTSTPSTPPHTHPLNHPESRMESWRVCPRNTLTLEWASRGSPRSSKARTPTTTQTSSSRSLTTFIRYVVSTWCSDLSAMHSLYCVASCLCKSPKANAPPHPLCPHPSVPTPSVYFFGLGSHIQSEVLAVLCGCTCTPRWFVFHLPNSKQATLIFSNCCKLSWLFSQHLCCCPEGTTCTICKFDTICPKLVTKRVDVVEFYEMSLLPLMIVAGSS